MPASPDQYKQCPKCGAFYVNFCLNCEKRGLEERVWEALSRNGLNEDELIRILAEQVKDGRFPALNLAIALRDMKPADRHEVNIEEGNKIKDARDRLATLLSDLAKRKRAERNPE